MNNSDQRHNDLKRAAVAFRKQGLDIEAIRAGLDTQNAAFANGPISDYELRGLLKWVDKHIEPEQRAETPRRVGASTFFDTMQEEELHFFWPDVLPLGAVVLFAGEPDEGKSLVSLDLAARASRGRPLPTEMVNGFPGPVTTLMVFIEDGASLIVRPRLRVAGADLANVAEFRMRLADSDEATTHDYPTFPDDADALEAEIVRLGARVVIIDPITAFLGDKVNSWRATDVRRALNPFLRMAERLNLVIICLIHVNKNERASAINRISESKAFAAVARAVYLFAEDPATRGRKVMVPVKANWSATKPAFAYTIMSSPDDPKHPVVAWETASFRMSAKDLLRDTMSGDPKGGDKTELAVALLRDLLWSGEKLDVATIKAQAEKSNVSWSTMQRAGKALGVITEKGGFQAGGTWRLTVKLAPPLV